MTRPWLSGFCSPDLPADSHARCKGATVNRGQQLDCACFCHMAPDPSPAPALTVVDAADAVGVVQRASGMAGAGEAPRLGIYEDLDERIYHADPTSLSASGMKDLNRSPAHFLHTRTHPKTSAAMDLGGIAHKLVLGAGAEFVVVEGNRNRNDVKAAIAEAEAEGKVVLKPEQLAAAERMADRVLTHKVAGPMFTNPGRSELSMFWHDPAFDVIRRCRWDRLGDDGIAADLKTTTSAEPTKAIPRHIVDFGYDLSAVNYLAIAAGLGVEIAAYALVFVEVTEPHPVVVVELNQDFLERGAALVAKALATYRHCLDTNTWPSYCDDDFLTVAPPKWADTAEQIHLSIPEGTAAA